MVKGDYSVEQIISKAQTLIEALPFIQKFQGKTVVVKYGGSAMLDEKLKYNVIKDVALLKLVGMKPVIVHGGGKEISKWVEKVGKEAEFINGLRVTDAETMEIAEMVLSKVNKSLVSLMQQVGLKAVGISGKDGGLLKVKKRFPGGKDIGYVGEVTEVDTEILNTLIEHDFIPVVAPIGVSDEFEDYNINADDAACAVATALNAEKLVFLTDIEGVFIDPTDKSTLISEMNLDEARELIDNGVVGGGMLPKLNNCIAAMDNGVARVHILDGRLEHCLLLEFFTEKGIGTAILKTPLF
ncbi:acetylglutamate kinase [Coprococcus sp. CAG:782]|jgi:acetylglutamate kinase|uniref:acetylglutamate kinase n=1 Tax=Coprococcus sp. OM04-5BH TaxID=2293093 RepID=UPI00033C1706|nr:acetylglutamate kinase [Coprococcus sp. OM04-5BH]MEE0036126.1 acetylglutamate kinase [Coprococcus sp.]RHV31804.1 acetylglutamate kinase [Coprococcus sp. OM04-5BH]CCY54367.1 acetylglutamate kinase [Coprococcus sp. CAG:782]